MIRILTVAMLMASAMACTQKAVDFQDSHYTAYDLTAENLFSANIEGPDVDSAGNLYVVNYRKDGTIGLVHPDGQVELFVNLPEGSTANAIRFDSHGTMLLADFTGHNVLAVNMKTKAISAFCHNDLFNQPNDIILNKKDQIFASDPSWKTNTGKLWRIDADGKPTLLSDTLGTTNGIELSPDEKTLYVAVKRTVWKFDLDEQGNISNKQKFQEFPDFGTDGMKCDANGNLYVTRHGKGAVAIVSPEGKLIHEVLLKGKGSSNIVFGGTDGKTCFVTLQDRKCVEMFRSDVPGRRWK